jgi:flagellar assembly factor FliW
MDVSTTRFGVVSIDEGDVLTFADGLIGMESCCRWVLLADAQNSALGWLQCVDLPQVALAVASPRRFVPDYQVRVSRRDIEPLGLKSPRDAHVLVIVNQVNGSLTLNLKAPLVLHLESRLGRQMIAKDDHAVQHLLPGAAPLRKTA